MCCQAQLAWLPKQEPRNMVWEDLRRFCLVAPNLKCQAATPQDHPRAFYLFYGVLAWDWCLVLVRVWPHLASAALEDKKHFSHTTNMPSSLLQSRYVSKQTTSIKLCHTGNPYPEAGCLLTWSQKRQFVDQGKFLQDYSCNKCATLAWTLALADSLAVVWQGQPR